MKHTHLLFMSLFVSFSFSQEIKLDEVKVDRQKRGLQKSLSKRLNDKRKKDPEKYTIWKLEQLINYGLNGEKIEEKDLRKYWHKINIDPKRRDLLAFWLWPTQY